jgi:sec-independent protein translocase protein TatC
MALLDRLKRRQHPGLPESGTSTSGEGVTPIEDGMGEMGFLDHLEEFRMAIIKGLLALVASSVVAYFFRGWIINVLLLGPKRADFFMYRVLGITATPFDLQNRTITGQFFADIGTIVAVGVIIGSPIFVYQIWKFIEPGLYKNEKKGLRFSAVFATFFFALGISFGYLIITPLALQFFAQYQISPEIANQFDITKYFGMITFWSFGVGMLFELPVVIYFLAKMGIATPAGLRRVRKYALILALTLGALFTPPDPVSQVLVATPLLLLYEISIWIAHVVSKRRQKELDAALS